MIYGEQRNIDAHSGKYEDDDEDSQCPAEESGHGHFFVRKTFHKPTYCHHCTDMLWGLIGQGFVCEGMVVIVHLNLDILFDIVCFIIDMMFG